MNTTFPSWAVLAVVLTLPGVVAAPGPAAVQRVTPDQQRIIDRIIELQREIDRLLVQLPESLRAQVREDLSRQEAAGVGTRTTARTATTGVAATVGSGASGGAPSSVTPFDRNRDGTLTSADAVWQALRLWVDANRDGTMSRGEVTVVSDGAIRQIDVRLATFVTDDGATRSIRRGDRIELDLKGDAFRGAVGILCLDLDSIAEAGFEIRSTAGERLQGVLPFESGWRVRLPDGRDVILR